MCECRERIDASLEPYGGRLAACFSGRSMRFEPYLIQTEKREGAKRGARVPLVLATFCPFCGEKVERPPATLQCVGLSAEGG